MYDGRALMFMIAETSIHAGSGMSVGYVDLPLQRDVVREIPIIQSSGVKGALRDFFEEIDKKKTEIIFGPEDGSQYSSAISFSDAKLLFFPVKSLYGVFAYITCPMVINDFLRDIKNVDPKISYQIDILPTDNMALTLDPNIISLNNNIVLNDILFQKEKINDNYLRDLLNTLKNKIFPDNNEYRYWKENFLKRIAIVNDSVFRDFTLLSTEIVTRNKINDDTGVVDESGGGLWSEENLPQDSILYSLLFASKPYSNDNNGFSNGSEIINYIKEKLDKNRIQIGGHKTIGKGFVFINFWEQGVNN
jgi:CRISPR-associated protein Cmr4